MSYITTHVLDATLGRAAVGIPVALDARSPDGHWTALARGVTDADGRVDDLLPPDQALTVGIHRLVFDTQRYFRARGITGFYPEVAVAFEVVDPAEHHHVPLLLSPYGYSTYRGS